LLDGASGFGHKGTFDSATKIVDNRHLSGASSPFRGVTYTTVGYGDLVLAKPWRVLTPIKGLTGALMWLIHGCIFRFREPVYHAVHAPAS
jgi:hypothetical protein